MFQNRVPRNGTRSRTELPSLRRRGRGSSIVASGLSLLLSIGLGIPFSWGSGEKIVVNGTVFSVDDKAPIAGARIHFGNPRSGEIVTSEATADDGSFDLDGLTPGTWEVAVESSGGLFVVAAPWVLAEGNTAPPTLQLMVSRGEDSGGAASRLRTAGGRASVWNNPATAALIVVGAAVVAGALIDAATDDEDAASN